MSEEEEHIKECACCGDLFLLSSMVETADEDTGERILLCKDCAIALGV